MEPVMSELTPDSDETLALLERIQQGDRQALDRLLKQFQTSLLGFIEARLDPRIRARLDAADVLQETNMEVMRRMSDYLQRRPMPFHLWIRRTAYERVLNAHRHEKQVAGRTVFKEQLLPDRSSMLLARPLLGSGPTPSQAAEAREFAERVSLAVSLLEEGDRQILLLRHADEMPYEEIGCLLDIEPAAARRRYGRALLRLRKILVDQGLLDS
jgi:RNA polymerase sigma-70 factor (ECF subfamily)